LVAYLDGRKVADAVSRARIIRQSRCFYRL